MRKLDKNYGTDKNIFVALGLSVLGRGMRCKVSEYSGAAVKNTILS